MGKGHLLAIGSANEKQERKSNRGFEGTSSVKRKVGPGTLIYMESISYFVQNHHLMN